MADLDCMDSADILGELGLFASHLSEFTVRESQIEMAMAIESAIAERHTLLAESGTGTGKTFAYLVPALLAGKKTLISTGTKHLQEQLYHRDIPMVLDILAAVLDGSRKVSLLKGRANYLCLHRLQQTRISARKLEAQHRNELEAVAAWLPRTKAGDVSELVEVPEESRLWPQLTSTVDNCLGQSCSFFEDCYVNRARKRAVASDVVVINHHLYFADKALKEDGFGSLLPDAECVVFDEAHQIPDVAANFLGQSFSSWQILELAADTRAAELQEKSLVSGLTQRIEDLEKSAADLRLGLGLNERRVAWLEVLEETPAFAKRMLGLVEQLEEFAGLLAEAAVAGEALARCHERAHDLSKLCRALVADENHYSTVRWLDIGRRTFRLHETPLRIGDALNAHFGNHHQTRIFTSATLSVDGDFEHFRSLCGITAEAKTAAWESPFDYFEQAVLYVPEGLPAPREANFSQVMYDKVEPLLQASDGRAFILFTSFRVMQEFEQLLSDDHAEEFTILMQGETSKRELLQNFQKQPKAILLATMSFWEGVDVPGDDLRLVVIDKLPFESPFEPVLKARLKALEEAGENPFMNYQVPRAVITLRQGAGRLIRSQADRGVLMICDSRLRGTRYGKIFLNSLPRMRRTADEDKVCGFLNALKSHSANGAKSGPVPRQTSDTP